MLLSEKENAVLNIFQDDYSVSAPEVAVQSRMTPSEAQAIIERLRTEGLIEAGDKSLFRLTGKGRSTIRRSKTGPQLKHFAGPSAPTIEWDQLNNDLDSALEKLS